MPAAMASPVSVTVVASRGTEAGDCHVAPGVEQAGRRLRRDDCSGGRRQPGRDALADPVGVHIAGRSSLTVRSTVARSVAAVSNSRLAAGETVCRPAGGFLDGRLRQEGDGVKFDDRLGRNLFELSERRRADAPTTASGEPDRPSAEGKSVSSGAPSTATCSARPPLPT